MTYYLTFAEKLERDGLNVVNNPEAFVDMPITVSTPKITAMLRDFIGNIKIQEVGIVEPKTVENKQTKKVAEKNRKDKESVDKNKPCKNKPEQSVSSVRAVAAVAYICQPQDIEGSSSLDDLCSELTAYLKECVSEISKEKILCPELSYYFAGMIEAAQLRNYLSRFVKDSKKIYRNGYIYIMEA